MNTPPMFRRFQLKRVLSALLIFATSAMAQWTTSTTLNTPVGVSVLDNQNATMVSDGAGGAIVVWEEDSSGTTAMDIIAQRIDALGNPRWGATGVSVCVEAGDQRTPTIGIDGSGGAIITWYDGRGVDNDIYAQRVAADGSLMWSTNGVALCLAPGNQWDPVIVSDAAGGAIIAWYEARYDTAADIFAQRVNGTGIVQWAIDGVPLCAARNGQVTPVITTDGAGGAVVAWLDFRDGVVELFSQRVNQSGISLWTVDGVRLCDASDFQYSPTIASDGAGGAIIAWHDFRSGTTDIYAQRMSGTGVRQWPATGAEVCTAANYQYGPRIVSDGASGGIICWYDYRNGVHSDIFAQRMTPLGGVAWTLNGLLLCGAINDQQFPSIAIDGRGGAFVGWQDNRNGPNADVFAHQVSHLGVTGFPTNGVPVSMAVNGQQFPELISNSSGGVILVWEDRRTGTQQDIYAHRIVLGNPDASFGYWVGGVSGSIEAAPSYAGLHPGALDGTDSRDIEEPFPLPTNYVSVTSLLSGFPSQIQDVREETAQLASIAKRWILLSRTSAAGSLVNLVFTEDRLPANFTPVLYPLGGSGSFQELRSTPVYSYTAPSTPGEPHDLLLLLGDSTKPSISVVGPNGGEVLVVGFPHTITWNSSDASGLLRHYIYFTLTGAPPYTLLDSAAGQSQSYVWTPSDASMNAFIHIVALDSVLNMYSDTSDAPFTIVSGDSVAYMTFPRWNMVSVPVLQTDMTPQGIFADDFGATPINVYGFDPINGYIVPDTLRLGQGYWLLTPLAQVIDAVGTAQASTSTPLQLGWNMIGNPFPAPLQKSSLRFTDGVTTRTMNEAVIAGWLANLLYGFDGAAYVPENLSLAVWNAYWMRALVPGISILYDLDPSPETNPWSAPNPGRVLQTIKQTVNRR